ncbi:MAG TPA: SH3 domain-containing protein, partial [Spirochaetia bacterium]|nr:SH3 domain-containing protein [Spirochaetia bacterium]
KQTQVRDKPSYLGKILGVLSYGDRVTVVDDSNKAWLKVTGPDGKLTGWVSASALTTKKIVLAAGSENVQQGASSGEVALAGKGFNEDVEQKYKSEGKLDYTWVDKMETYNPSPDQVAAFLQQGGLNTSGGAQ